MVQINVQVWQQAGLHARPAASLVKLTNSFTSEIKLCYQDKSINAKSMISILTCGLGAGEQLAFTIHGPDEQQAAQALSRFFTPDGRSCQCLRA